MTLEHYPRMNREGARKIIGEAKARWDVMDVLVVTASRAEARPTRIVLVVVPRAHGTSFDACEFIMDYLRRPRAVLETRKPQGAALGRGATRRRSRATWEPPKSSAAQRGTQVFMTRSGVWPRSGSALPLH